MRSRHLFVALLIAVLVVGGYAVIHGPGRATSTSGRGAEATRPGVGAGHPGSGSDGNGSGGSGSDGSGSGGRADPAAPSPTPAPPFDVSGLVHPPRDYLGVALAGAPQRIEPLESFAELTGHRPTMVTVYESFDDDFAAAEVRRSHAYGALTIIRWEPFGADLADIAAGRHDEYIRSFATDVRTLNLPIALTFAHEMNGYWYPWGRTRSSSADYVAAWRHLHRIFDEADARNVIWTWTPNAISGSEDSGLAPWYPGEDYVDWVGIDGYIVQEGPQTYDQLFGRTMAVVKRFSKRPFLIVETGVAPGAGRTKALRSLLEGVAEDRRTVGLVYFNRPGTRQWQIDDDPELVQAYRQLAQRLPYGFVVR